MNFNSTMVRLKVVAIISSIIVAIFQFHYGSVKSAGDAILSLRYWRFQFHYGSVKRHLCANTAPADFNFNSTMVRLKETWKSRCVNVTEFQFHYGSVKRGLFSTLTLLEQGISIPLWFG